MKIKQENNQTGKGAGWNDKERFVLNFPGD
jgi:hypothetical protein